jgi:hypothetical protein
LPHCWPVGPEFRPFDIKEQFYVIYFYAHEGARGQFDDIAEASVM